MKHENEASGSTREVIEEIIFHHPEYSSAVSFQTSPSKKKSKVQARMVNHSEEDEEEY